MSSSTPNLPTATGLSRRRVLGLGLSAGTALTIAGCGGADPVVDRESGGGGGKDYTGPKVDLAFWNGFTGGDGPVMRKLVDEFNAAHGNIKVTMTVYQWIDYYQKVPTAVTTGKGPDIGIMHVDSLGTNAARQVIVPLDDVARALELKQADFADVVWKAGEYGGKRYGIPLDMHPLGFYYNKKLMAQARLDPEKPPQTADEYAAALAAFKAAGVQGMWMTPAPFTGTLMFQALLWQHGGELFNADASKAEFGSDAGVTALTWMVDVVRNGHSPRNVANDADVIAFQNNKTAFNWNGIWQINNFTKVSGLEWGVAPLPQIGTEKAAWAGSHNFVVMKQATPDTNKLEASKVFINWISQRSLAWAEGGQVPARKSVRDDPKFAQIPHVDAFAKQVDYLHFAPAVPGIGDATATMDTAVNEAVLLKKEPAKALADAVARADKLLEQNKKKYGY